MIMLIGILIICISFDAIAGILIYFLNKYLTKKNEIEEQKAKNEKHRIFDNVDIQRTKEIVDDYFELYINRYAVNKFIAKNELYIRPADQEEMARNITRNIMLEISEIYVYYIRLLADIPDTESLTRYIYQEIKNKTIAFVADYNQARTPDLTNRL